MKLYEVNVNTSMYVVAKSKEEAQSIAKSHMLIDNIDDESDYDCIENPGHIWAGWKTRKPYGLSRDLTVEEWLCKTLDKG